MFAKFTTDARQVVVLSQEEARSLDHNYIGTEHLLVALVGAPGAEDTARRTLRGLGATAERVRASLGEVVGRGAQPVTGHIPFTPRAKRVLELAGEESDRMHDRHVGTEHVVLGLIREVDGLACQLLTKLGAGPDAVRPALLTALAAEAGSARRRMENVERNRTPAAGDALARATELAGGGPVGSHHLLQALLAVDDSAAAGVLAGLGVDAAAVSAGVAAVDLEATTDMSPELRALQGTRLTVAGDEARLVFSDAEMVAKVRRLVELNGGADVSGAGRLGGAFVTMREAAEAGFRLAELVLSANGPQGGEPGAAGG